MNKEGIGSRKQNKKKAKRSLKLKEKENLTHETAVYLVY